MGLATSTFYILYDTGIGMGPFLMGFLIPLTGFQDCIWSWLFLWHVVLDYIFFYTENGLHMNSKNLKQVRKTDIYEENA